ncbi:MAG: homoserine O-acetyltransferase [Candidatus Eremiobacteraeota bacterium]|nr:homoserine O-acetyltransferase [Candidatus Eremiobacteraeota bacterium]
MIVEKKRFSAESFHFEEADTAIPVSIGYETYGALSESRDNAVLVCHYFTGTGHAAGRYSPEDPAPGWWNSLIGPGKPLDTERFFVICSDTPANINFHNPKVITTGPATVNPLTGKEYGLLFPIFTLKDVVRLQKLLLESLGIPRLRLVTGPSMGGLQAFMWARHFPAEVEQVIAVCATPEIGPYGIMVPNQLGIDAIMLDPNFRNGDYYGKEPPYDGLLLAFKNLLMATRTEGWAERSFGRAHADSEYREYEDPRRSLKGKFLVEKEVEAMVKSRMQFFDPNSYLYIAKANTLFDLREGGESYEKALGHIEARTLMVIDKSDSMFTPAQAEKARRHIRDCRCAYYDSGNGHLSCIFEQGYLERYFREFLG